jgi:hypothetical protein
MTTGVSPDGRGEQSIRAAIRVAARIAVFRFRGTPPY